jgi:hypothetical protein
MRRTPHALLVIPLVVIVGLTGCGGDDDGGRKATKDGAFCDEAKAIDRQFDAIGQAVDPSGMPSATKFEQEADSLDQIAKGAPKAISADMRTIAAGVRKIAGALAEIDLADEAAVNDPANAARLQEMRTEMEKVGREVEASGDRVATYLERKCGVSTSSSTTTSTSTTTTTAATTTTGG